MTLTQHPSLADPGIRQIGMHSQTAEPAAEPRRILFLDHTASLGGGEIALFNLVTNLDCSRFQPAVLLFSEGPLAQKLRAAGIQTHILPLDPGVGSARKDSLGASSLLKVGHVIRSLRFVRLLARTIRKLQPDVVHTNSLKSDLLGGLAARLARVPCIWHVRDRITTDYLPGSVAAFFRRAARHIPTHVIAISQATLDTLALPERATRRNSRARVIYDGIPDPYAANPAFITSAEPSSAVKIGIVGRLSPWKGQHVFIEAAARVLQEFPAARFQIIGAALFAEHDYEQQLHTLARDRHIDHAIEFTGFRSDVPALISALDILVHASTIGEPFGQVIVEGMIAARPVVATRGGGVPEIVADGTGILVPMNDPAALASALSNLLRDPHRRATMGRAARQHVLDHFTIQHTARNVEALYDDLLGIHAVHEKTSKSRPEEVSI